MFKNEKEYLHHLYQSHVGEYMSQNHFINEDEYICSSNLDSMEASLYSFDMLQRYIQLTHKTKGTVELSLLSNYAAFIEVFDLSTYFEPNIHEMQIDVDKTVISIIDGVEKYPLSRFNHLSVTNAQE